jgi:geranylgeranyl pyrophosphate synthase
MSGIPVTAFQIYDDLSDAWSQEDDEISDQYLHLRLSHKVLIYIALTFSN